MKLKYPCLKRDITIPAEYVPEVESIKAWLKHQPHIPPLSDEFVYTFLHCNYYRPERAKDNIDAYFTVRGQCPELFDNRDVNKLLEQLELYDMAMLPQSTKEGYQVLLYRLKDTDTSKFNFVEALKTFFAWNDVVISERGISEGYIVVFDMNGLSFGHLARVSVQLQAVKKFMVYIQLQLHTSVDTLKETFSLSILPKDYGGEAPSTRQLSDQLKSLIKDSYGKWLKESGQLVAVEKKRVGKPRKEYIGEMEGSFRSLSID
nr:PREDICTED: alpha-tocopherol transfer protein-like isoform X2 [Bemisia tabaci]